MMNTMVENEDLAKLQNASQTKKGPKKALPCGGIEVTIQELLQSEKEIQK